jgi:hypothetical protein
MTPRFALLLAGALIWAGAARAQAINDNAKSVLGSWEFSTAERDKRCNVTLTEARATAGYKLEYDPKCVDDFPLLREVAGWSYPDNDLLRFVDARGRALVEFSEVESGMYEAPTQGYGVLFLQNAADAGGPPIKAEDVAGDWALTRGGGKPLCVLSLTMTPAADEGFALVVKPGCDQSIARLNFTRWRIDRDELMLSPGRGNPWRFEQEDANNWERVPETANPYTLVRQ